MKKRVISVILALCLAVTLLPARAWAAEVVDSGSCGANVTWTLDNNGLLTISGTGEMEDYASGDAPWYKKGTVTSVVIEQGVTSIGKWAFTRCEYLENVTIPNSVTSIGHWAFSGCIGLASVTIPDSVTSIGYYAFSNTKVSSIQVDDNNSWFASQDGVLFTKDEKTLVVCPGGRTGTYTIPDGVTSIRDAAFSGCSGLISVTIPDSVTSIGAYAFYDCPHLTNVGIPASVTGIGDSAFRGCSSLADVYYGGSEEDWKQIFISDNNGELTSANIHYNSQMPASFTVTFDSQGGSEVSDQTVPNGGKATKPADPTRTDYTFGGWYKDAGCENAWDFDTDTVTEDTTLYAKWAADSGTCGTGVTWTLDNDGLLTISGTGEMEYYGFSSHTPWYDKSRVTSVVIEQGVTSIGYTAFSECSGLISVTIPSSVTSIGGSAFSGCSGLTSVTMTIPSSVTSIGDSAFSGCSGLTSVTIPDGVTSIGDSAFYGCSGLTSVTIPDNVTSIGNSAFFGCSGLTSVTISNNVISIGYYAFYGCSGLTSVTIPASVDSIGNYAFSGTKISSIQVDSDNPHYASQDGVLFTKDKTTLLAYPGGKTGAYDIPNSVTSIGESAFSGCSGLTIVGIPAIMTSIGASAFFGCSRLNDVYYGGSEEEWNSIIIGILNENLTNANIHYNSQMPTFFTVTFDSQGGSAVSNQTVPDGNKVTEPKAPARDGHTFGGWYKDAGCENPWDFDTDTVTEDTTLYAKWTDASKKGFTVTFEPHNDTYSISKDTDIHGILAPDDWPDDPTRAGYAFNGWHTSETGGEAVEKTTIFDKDTTVHAQWNPNENTVRFDLNYSGSTGAPADQTILTGEKVVEPEKPARDGYTFDGWYKEAGCENPWDFDTDTVIKDTTLYAKWTEDGSTADQKFTVTFDSDGGSAVAPQTIEKGGKVSKPANPAKSGYTFAGWYKGAYYTAEAWNFDTDTVTGDITLYARWITGYYTITLDPNGGTLRDDQPKTLQTDSAGKLTYLPIPTRDGYMFDGWYTARDNSGVKVYAGTTAFNDHITLYAHWIENTDEPDDTKKTYTIKFDANGGTGGAELTTGPDGKLSALPSDPTRSGYDFDGWYTATTGGEKVTTAMVFEKDTTVYARWNERSSEPSATKYRIYTPDYVSGGSVDVSHSSAAEGTRITIELSPRSGYEMDQLSVVNLDTGRELPLTKRSTDEYTFVMPDSSVEIEVSFLRIYTSGGSSYVPTKSPASNKPIRWYFKDGQIRHVTDGLVPYGTLLSRDMLVSVLYNMDPSSTGEQAFWATKHNIVSDIYSGGLWGMDKNINREQAAMILYAYARHMGYDLSPSADLTGYEDYGRVRTVARSAMSWAQATGLITGNSSNNLEPGYVLTCGEMNAILSRFVSTIA